MSIKKKIKHAFFSRPKGILLFYRLRILREKRCVGKEDDYHFICRIFRERYGREIDLSTPSTYSEKLQWLKLFYHDPIMEVCSDKYAVRDYVKQQGHEELLNECYGVYENANDIAYKRKLLTNSDELMSEPFFNPCQMQSYSNANEIDIDFVKRPLSQVKMLDNFDLSPEKRLRAMEELLP